MSAKKSFKKKKSSFFKKVKKNKIGKSKKIKKDSKEPEKTGKSKKQKELPKKWVQPVPKKSQSTNSLLPLNPSIIKCKLKRLSLYYRKKMEQSRQKKKERKQRQNSNQEPDPIPTLSTENKLVYQSEFIKEETEDLVKEEATDEFANYFNSEETPKILLTTSELPTRNIFKFLKELQLLIPGIIYYPRQHYSIQQICEFAKTKNYTHILIMRESFGITDELILIKLHDGPTFIYKITNIILSKNIFHHGNALPYNPELILNNFNTKLGRRIARGFMSMFKQVPEFEARQAVVFHNQRDFVFVRGFRYIFAEGKEKIKTNLQPIGPKFTLKLQEIQQGIYDPVFTQYEHKVRSDMYVSRKACFL